MKTNRKTKLIMLLCMILLVGVILLYIQNRKTDIVSNFDSIAGDKEEYPIINELELERELSFSNNSGEYCYLDKDSSNGFFKNFNIPLESFSPNSNSMIYVPIFKSNFSISGYKENFDFRVIGKSTHKIYKTGNKLNFVYVSTVGSEHSTSYWDVVIGDLKGVTNIRTIRVINYGFIGINEWYDNVDYFNTTSPYIDDFIGLQFKKNDCSDNDFPQELFPITKQTHNDTNKRCRVILEKPNNEILQYFYYLLGGKKNDLQLGYGGSSNSNYVNFNKDKIIDYFKRKNFLLDNNTIKVQLKENNNVIKGSSVIVSNYKNSLLNLKAGILREEYNPFPGIYDFNIKLEKIDISLKNDPVNIFRYNLPCDLSKIDRSLYNQEIHLKIYSKNDVFGEFDAKIDRLSPSLIIEAEMQDGKIKVYQSSGESTIYGDFKNIKILDIYDRNKCNEVYDYEYDLQGYKLRDYEKIKVSNYIHQLAITDRAGNKTKTVLHNTSLKPVVEMNVISDVNKYEYLKINIFGDALLDVNYAYVLIRKNGVIQEADSNLKIVLPFTEYIFTDYGVYDVDVVVGNRHITKSFNFYPDLKHIGIKNKNIDNMYTGRVEFNGVQNVNYIAYYNGKILEDCWEGEDYLSPVFNPKELIEGQLKVVFMPKGVFDKKSEILFMYDNMEPRIKINDMFTNKKIQDLENINNPIRIIVDDINIANISLKKDGVEIHNVKKDMLLFDNGSYELIIVDRLGYKKQLEFHVDIKSQENIEVDINKIVLEAVNRINDFRKDDSKVLLDSVEEKINNIVIQNNKEIKTLIEKQENIENSIAGKLDDNRVNIIKKIDNKFNEINEKIKEGSHVKLDKTPVEEQLVKKENTNKSAKKNNNITYILVASSCAVLIFLAILLAVKSHLNKKKADEQTKE